MNFISKTLFESVVNKPDYYLYIQICKLQVTSYKRQATSYKDKKQIICYLLILIFN